MVKSPEIAEILKNAKIQKNAWNFAKARNSYTEILHEIPEELRTEKVTILQELGVLEFDQEDFQVAKSYFLELQKFLDNTLPESFHTSFHLIAIGILTKNDLLVSKNLDPLLPTLRSNRPLLSSFLEQIGRLVLIGSKKTYRQNILSFRDHLISNNLSISSLFGHFLLLHGYYELVLEHLKASIEKTSEDVEKASLFFDISIVYSQIGDFHSAIENLKRSVELNPLVEEVYVLMAECCASLNNYTQSIKILEQGKTQLKEAFIIQELLDKYKTLEQDVLNIDRRLPEKLQRILYEGERLYQNYLVESTTDDLDTSSVVLQYSKFVESALDHYIANPFFQSIIAKEGWNIQRSFWPRSDQIFRRYKNAIEQTDRKQLTLGQWEFIIERFEEQRSTGIPSLVEEYFNTDKDSIIDKECILEICSTLKAIRNPVAHREIIKLDKLREKRPQIVQKINLLIDLLLKINLS
ncbi:MAG: tetratricopeptide repeat protein [Candidatus Hodarchaeota archaeon]